MHVGTVMIAAARIVAAGSCRNGRVEQRGEGCIHPMEAGGQTLRWHAEARGFLDSL